MSLPIVSTRLPRNPSVKKTVFEWFTFRTEQHSQNQDTLNVKPPTLSFTTTESIDTLLQHFWESEEIYVPRGVAPDDT